MNSVLVVDDDPQIVRTLSVNLRARGFDVERAGDGRSALSDFADGRHTLVILDLGLPDIDGVEVLRRIRAVSNVPVIVLSARHGSDDKVEALDEGADDYVTKPFDMQELLARVRAAQRRTVETDEEVIIEAGTLSLNLTERSAQRSGQSVRLTPTEWRLLDVLGRARGRLVRQSDLLHQVWGPSYDRETHYLRVYMAQLRRKLEDDPSRPQHLITEPGLGYRFIS